jgi:hypothetical protein
MYVHTAKFRRMRENYPKIVSIRMNFLLIFWYNVQQLKITCYCEAKIFIG